MHSACGKPKTQISCAVTAQLISASIFATQIVQSLLFLKSKLQASSLYLRAGRFVSDLVGNQDCCFSHAKPQIEEIPVIISSDSLLFF